jgi:DNA mismatch repair protein MutS2
MTNHTLAPNHIDEIPVLDAASADVILWADIWRRFQPVTPYGQRWKVSVQPFVPGQEEAWTRAVQQLERDADVLTEEDVRRLREQLRRVPDIEDTLSTLTAPDAVIQPKQALLLKQCAFIGRACANDEAAQRMGGLPLSLWTLLMDAFGEDTSPTFAVEHIGGEAYQTLGREVANAAAAYTERVRRRDQDWMEAVGRKPNRDGVLALSLPVEATTAERLKRTDGVRWIKDTPFESVFEVLPTAAMAAAAERLEAAQRALEDCAQQVMRRLTDAVRAELPHWCEAVRQLCHLDIRLAKVQMLRSMSGCVPHQGDSVHIRLVDGVHVGVADALQQRQLDFTPLTWAVDAGVSVICGSNMGGKTVAMTTLCACQMLAQYAMPVPARQFETALVRMVRFCSGGATDAKSGLSSFGAEVVRLTHVWEELQVATPALLCFDEPGKATNPVEGEALTIGLMRCLKALTPQVVGVIATHFAAPLRELDVSWFRVSGLQATALEVREAFTDATDKISRLERAMRYTIERLEQGEVPHEAVLVAQWMGAPERLLQETRAFLEGRTEP